MRRFVRPRVTVGIVIVGAGIVVAAPLDAPPPQRHPTVLADPGCPDYLYGSIVGCPGGCQIDCCYSAPGPREPLVDPKGSPCPQMGPEQLG